MKKINLVRRLRVVPAMTLAIAAFAVIGQSVLCPYATAQVAIGGDGTVATGAVLDLSQQGAATGGLYLPQVATNPTSGNLLKDGMLIYNTTDHKIYTYDGGISAWKVAGSGSDLKIITQPAKFTFKRSTDPIGDPLASRASATPLTVVVDAASAAAGITYQWYKLQMNPNAPATKLTGNGATSATYIVPALAVNDSTVAAWGLSRYYCSIKNAAGDSINSEIAEVAIGCGAKTTDGGWLRFMCHNVGAAPTPAPTAGQSDSESLVAHGTAFGTNADATGAEDARGYLFQWGRADGGRRDAPVELARIPMTVAHPDTFYNAQHIPFKDWFTYVGQVNSTAPATTIPYFSGNWAWDGNSNLTDAVCGGAQWLLPYINDWEGIGGLQGRTSTTNNLTGATNNSLINAAVAVRVNPDGLTTTLVLPWAGVRSPSGVIQDVGKHGEFWLRTHGHSATGKGGWTSGDYLLASDSREKSWGLSVRCVNR